MYIYHAAACLSQLFYQDSPVNTMIPTSSSNETRVPSLSKGWETANLNVREFQYAPAKPLATRVFKSVLQVAAFLVLLPFILVALMLFVLFVLLFGRWYELYATKRDRALYHPPASQLKPYGPNGKNIHVVHLTAPDSKLPPCMYVSGLGASMSIVEPLLHQIRNHFPEPLEIASYDSPGYGASEPPNSWESEGVESELDLLRLMIEKLHFKKPVILFGGSAGASLVQLYRLRYPQDVAGVVLYDPTPSAVYSDPNSPMQAEFLKATKLYGQMAAMSKWAVFRPMAPLMKLIPGEFGDVFRTLPLAHTSIFMTETVLLKTGNHFRYWREIMDGITKLSKQLEEGEEEENASASKKSKLLIRSTPLLLVSAQRWSEEKPHGGKSREAMREWWHENQLPFLRTSDRSAMIVRADYTHVDMMLDMKLAAKCIQQVCKQLQSQ